MLNLLEIDYLEKLKILIHQQFALLNGKVLVIFFLPCILCIAFIHTPQIQVQNKFEFESVIQQKLHFQLTFIDNTSDGTV